jgi:hypothetical protein
MSEVAMERVFYCAGSSFLTGTEVARALLDYARFVGMRDFHELVRVPTSTAEGAPGWTSMILSAATQLSSETVTVPAPELVDETFVERLRAEIEWRSHPQKAVLAAADPRYLDDAFEV